MAQPRVYRDRMQCPKCGSTLRQDQDQCLRFQKDFAKVQNLVGRVLTYEQKFYIIFAVSAAKSTINQCRGCQDEPGDYGLPFIERDALLRAAKVDSYPY